MIVQEMRLKKGWSQQQLADISGLNVRTIQRIDPRTGDGLGPSWILPKEVGDGGLFYAGGSVWAQSSGPSTIVQLDINTAS